jgi:hypothetical protein
MLPSEENRGTYRPVKQRPFGKPWEREVLQWNDRWDDTLKSLIDRFVPDLLRRSGWYDFFGACVMCDPPDNRLHDFADFGRVYPSPLWPVVDCELDEVDKSNIHSMVAPPIERVFKESYEDGGVFMEYRIVVDEHTRKADVIRAFRAIKAASELRNPGGRPAIDKLTAIQCAVLYDDYNGTIPEDGRVRLWTYKKFADKFRAFGVRNARSAEEHVKRGRDFRKKFRNP